MRPESYSTPSGIIVDRTVSKVPYDRGLRGLLRKLDTQRGVYLSSGYEYPERYSRWDMAAVAPPLEIVAAGANRLPSAELARRSAEPDSRAGARAASALGIVSLLKTARCTAR